MRGRREERAAAGERRRGEKKGAYTERERERARVDLVCGKRQSAPHFLPTATFTLLTFPSSLVSVLSTLTAEIVRVKVPCMYCPVRLSCTDTNIFRATAFSINYAHS